MEKIIEDYQTVIDKNEKLIANILHDIKSPLYSIKIGLQTNLENELNRDIFETTIDILDYIDKFLFNYSFKLGQFEDRCEKCDIKKIIDKKIENFKFVFINRKINIDLTTCTKDLTINSIEIFLSSIIGNILSNVAFHACENSNAKIKIYKKCNDILIEFENKFYENNSNFGLGLDFCSELTKKINSELKFTKTKTSLKALLKIKTM